jgi:hypothetical protein
MFITLVKHTLTVWLLNYCTPLSTKFIVVSQCKLPDSLQLPDFGHSPWKLNLTPWSAHNWKKELLCLV